MARLDQKIKVFEPGSIIAGRYRVLDVIGSGAVGIVVRVSDSELDREIVALKVLHPHLALESSTLKRFQQEIIISRQLSHPNIVRVFDFDSNGTQGLYFISMEFIQGPNLREFLSVHKAGRLAFDDAVRIVHQLALALSFAHEKGVIHRDIKPENTLLSAKGEVKLSDFGLAHTLQATIGLTATGDALGTPEYMAPEVFCGRAPDARSDIYSLGIIAYEIAAGDVPFQHENFVALAKCHMEMPVPEAVLASAGVPLWYQQLVMRCLAKERAERFQSCTELLDTLRGTASETLSQPHLVLPVAKKSKALQRFYMSRYARLGWRVMIFTLLAFGYWVIILNTQNYHSRRRLLTSIYSLEKVYRIELPAVKRVFGIPELPLRDPETVIHAMRANDHVMIHALLSADVELGYADGDGNTYIHYAIEFFDGKYIGQLAANGAPLNAYNKDGNCPLHAALKKQLKGAVEQLMYAGANPNLKDREGDTALHLAALARDFSSIRRIMEHGGFAAERNELGITALHIAARNADIASMRILLEHGADA
ncbi:MAG TPA: protein kinase, partial [Oligoflexia bacterium]|nr:protein kinase [Oligoflexia bacterium]